MCNIKCYININDYVAVQMCRTINNLEHVYKHFEPIETELQLFTIACVSIFLFKPLQNISSLAPTKIQVCHEITPIKYGSYLLHISRVNIVYSTKGKNQGGDGSLLLDLKILHNKKKRESRAGELRHCAQPNREDTKGLVHIVPPSQNIVTE